MQYVGSLDEREVVDKNTVRPYRLGTHTRWTKADIVSLN
jgi:hypothetical protein